MICDKCQSEVPEGKNYCPDCGQQLNNHVQNQYVPVYIQPPVFQYPPQPPPAKKNHGCLIAFIVFVIILISIPSVMLAMKYNKNIGNIFSDNNNTDYSNVDNKNKDTTIGESALDAECKQQPLYITSAKLVIQSNEYKSLYPDMLQAIIYNNTKSDIKNAVVAFAAWDKNNLPIKISGQLSFTGAAYITKVNFSDINLVGGASFGKGYGYNLKDGSNVETVKAIVVSYETFSGETWDNPYFKAFCTLYEGKKLP